MVNVSDTLKEAKRLIGRGWAAESEFNGWCLKPSPWDEQPPQICDCLDPDAFRFSVDGALARAAGLRRFYLAPIGLIMREALEAVTSPAWVAAGKLKPGNPSFALSSMRAAASSPPLEVWLRDPRRTQAQVLDVFNAAIAKAGRR